MKLNGMLIPLILVVFAGGFVGSLMSGGSLIVFTALAFLSMPVKTMIGTLKLAITVLGLASAGTYLKGGTVDVKKAPFLVFFSLPGAVLGGSDRGFLPTETPKNPRDTTALRGNSGFSAHKLQNSV